MLVKIFVCIYAVFIDFIQLFLNNVLFSHGDLGCPALPTPPTGIDCYVSDDCLGIHCCATIDLHVIQPSVSIDIVLDPCDFVISVAFGDRYFNTTLFTYEWGQHKEYLIGSSIKLRYV